MTVCLNCENSFTGKFLTNAAKKPALPDWLFMTSGMIFSIVFLTLTKESFTTSELFSTQS